MTLLTEPLAFVPGPSGPAPGLPVTPAALAMAQALAAQRAVAEQLAAHAELLAEMAERITACLAAGGKLLVAGEGAAMIVARHLAGQLSGRASAGRRPLAVLALSADGAAWSVEGREALFARQVRGLGRPGDALLVIADPGSSPPHGRVCDGGLLLPALQAAREEGMAAMGLLAAPAAGRANLSEDPQALQRACHLSLVMPAADAARQQEAQLFLGHLLCGLVETALGQG